MTNSPTNTPQEVDGNRRDFLLISTVTLGAAGAAVAAWPFIHSINPAKDVLALSTSEADLSAMEVGQSITVKWRGKPVFIRYRTEEEIQAALDDDQADLKDPQTDAERVQRTQWLVVIGVCTHLGCIPTGQNVGDKRGNYGGWYCPCHGSHYDTSGRIRVGPAPLNLFIPKYAFTDDMKILIG